MYYHDYQGLDLELEVDATEVKGRKLFTCNALSRPPKKQISLPNNVYQALCT